MKTVVGPPRPPVTKFRPDTKWQNSDNCRRFRAYMRRIQRGVVANEEQALLLAGRISVSEVVLQAQEVDGEDYNK